MEPNLAKFPACKRMNVSHADTEISESNIQLVQWISAFKILRMILHDNMAQCEQNILHIFTKYH